MAKPITVFLGPSLPRAEAESLLDADYLPPARHGDLYRVLTSGTRVILLIDGVFHSTPSVWQREVLAALDGGVRVIGASSMGALRGAELAPYGMTGCGTVFEWYRDGVIEADDEVALLHAPEELGYQALSEPLVNVRATLGAAVAANVVGNAEATALVEALRCLHFSERSYEAMWNTAAFSELPPASQEQLRSFVDEHAVDLKAADARLALQRAADALDESVPTPAPRWDRSIWDGSRILGAGLWHDGHAVTVGKVVEYARQHPELWAAELVPGADDARQALEAELHARFFALAHARSNGQTASDEELAPVMQAFAERWRLTPTAEHLAGNGLTARTYQEQMRERALFEWLLARNGDATSLVAAWATELGVSLPELPVEQWPREIAARGPSHFGYDWIPDVAFALELQLTGLAAKVAEAMRR